MLGARRWSWMVHDSCSQGFHPPGMPFIFIESSYFNIRDPCSRPNSFSFGFLFQLHFGFRLDQFLLICVCSWCNLDSLLNSAPPSQTSHKQELMVAETRRHFCNRLASFGNLKRRRGECGVVMSRILDRCMYT